MDDTIESKAAGDDTPPAPKITEITDEPPEKLLGKAEEDDDAGDAGDNAPDPAEDEDAEFVEDGRADKALDFVVAVLSRMGMDCTVDLMENDPGEPPSDIRIEITGADADRIVGKKGQTLAALQFLTNRVINRPSKPRRHILIDADGYRSRREHALTTMAKRLGKQAVEEGKIITFEPMSAQDRRIVHLALAKYPGVVTKSEGKGSTRRVQIIPVRD
ncbi:MAG: R3H domain-containing nucleic acid-binding protein [Polyangiaceae bacterium]